MVLVTVECGVDDRLVAQRHVDVREERKAVEDFDVPLRAGLLRRNLRPGEAQADEVGADPVQDARTVVEQVTGDELLVDRRIVEAAAVADDANARQSTVSSGSSFTKEPQPSSPVFALRARPFFVSSVCQKVSLDYPAFSVLGLSWTPSSTVL